MTRRRTGPPQPPAPKPAADAPRALRLATLIGVLVACALIASTVGTILLDQQGTAPEGAGQPTPAPGNEFEDLLRANLEANPADARSAVSLGNLLSARGLYGEAIDYYARAVELEPGNAGYRLDFALALAQTGALADAELQYRKALEANPNDAEALYFLGELYARWNPVRLDEAVASFEGAIAAEPSSVSADLARQELARLQGQREAATPAAGEEATP
ncbi:MAG: tetratricopeptide repeat protein [Chloroflexota bacterium]